MTSKVIFEKKNNMWVVCLDGLPLMKNASLTYLLIQMTKHFKKEGET